MYEDVRTIKEVLPVNGIEIEIMPGVIYGGPEVRGMKCGYVYENDCGEKLGELVINLGFKKVWKSEKLGEFLTQDRERIVGVYVYMDRERNRYENKARAFRSISDAMQYIEDNYPRED